jgi:TRAP-type uncharacterized transport system fused permease subunit
MTDERKQEVPEDQHVAVPVGEMLAEDDIYDTQALIEEFESESPVRDFKGWIGLAIGIIAVGLSVYALYATQVTLTTQIYRTTFLGVALVLTFLLYPWRRGASREVNPVDILLVIGSIFTAVYPMLDFDNFIYRAARPTDMDVWVGWLTIVLILEATRRTVGWILPAFAVALLAYLHWGYHLPGDWGHRGYDWDRIAGTMYISLEGIYGTALDVAATYIILFTIYGAVLEFSGAGKFFLDFSFAATGRKASGAGRTTTIAGFLLGTVSGSGVAPPDSLSYPALRSIGQATEPSVTVVATPLPDTVPSRKPAMVVVRPAPEALRPVAANEKSRKNLPAPENSSTAP